MYIRIQISRQKIKLDQYALDSNLVPELFDGHAHLLAHRLGVFQLLRNSQQPRLATKPPTTMYQNYTSAAYIYIYMCVCVIYISYIYIYMFIYTSVGNDSDFLVSNQVLAWAELTCIWRPDGTVVLAGTCCALGIQRSPRTFFLGPRQSHGGASTVSWIVIPMNYSYNLNISQQTLVNLVSKPSYKAT